MATGADGKVDKQIVDRLKRYADPFAFGKAGLEAQARILSGKVGEDIPMPDAKTDPDGAKKWREERGIPLEPTGYDVPDTVKPLLTEADAPVLASYTTFAHEHGMTPAQVKMNLEWYGSLVEGQRAAIEDRDKSGSKAVEETLRKDWANDFTDNQTYMAEFVKSAFGEVPFFMARIPDDPAYGEYAGMTLGNVPAIAKKMAELGRLTLGDVVLENTREGKAQASRKAELKNIMDTDIDKWNQSPDLRKEYFGILEKEGNRGGS